MYLLYVDDSGSPKDAKQQYFVLGGVAVFERQVHWLALELDAIADQFNPTSLRGVELHGSPMMNGREGWRLVPRADRIQTIKDALGVLQKSMQSTVAFAIAVRKSAIPGIDPVEWAFEELCRRFDEFLKQMYLAQQNRKHAHNQTFRKRRSEV